MSTERCPGLSVQSRLCSPHLLPQSPKAGAGRGGGGAGRTVTQMLFWLGGPYCHAIASLICSVSKGEMLSVFFHLVFFCVWLGVFCRFFLRSSCLRVVFLKKFSGANFCFWVSVLVVCFLVLFCLCFCFIIRFFAPETVFKKFS